MKRVLSLVLAVAVFFTLQITVFSRGFHQEGDYSSSKERFGFITGDTLVVFANEVEEDSDFREIWPGSSIYIPIGVLGGSGRLPTMATDKQIKDYKVAVSYKAVSGGQYIESVTIDNGKKPKVDGLPNGNYARIKLKDSFESLRSTTIEIKLVLSVNKISYPETQIELVFHLYNKAVDIDDNTVYPVMTATKLVSDHYTGQATFDFGNGIRYTARVARNTSYYLNLDRSDHEEVKDQYTKVYMEFYDFKGDQDTFASVGTLEIPINVKKFTPRRSNTPKIYVYEIIGNNLIAVNERFLSYDRQAETLYLQTQTLGSYVLSIEPLYPDVDTSLGTVIYSGYATKELDDDLSANTNTLGSGSSGGSGGSGSSGGSGTTDSSTPATSLQNTGNSSNVVDIYRTINADNESALNPSTSQKPIAGLALLGLLAGTACWWMWKKGWLQK